MQSEAAKLGVCVCVRACVRACVCVCVCVVAWLSSVSALHYLIPHHHLIPITLSPITSSPSPHLPVTSSNIPCRFPPSPPINSPSSPPSHHLTPHHLIPCHHFIRHHLIPQHLIPHNIISTSPHPPITSSPIITSPPSFISTACYLDPTVTWLPPSPPSSAHTHQLIPRHHCLIHAITPYLPCSLQCSPCSLITLSPSYQLAPLPRPHHLPHYLAPPLPHPGPPHYHLFPITPSLHISSSPPTLSLLTLPSSYFWYTMISKT